jgi:hypothetical protein
MSWRSTIGKVGFSSEAGIEAYTFLPDDPNQHSPADNNGKYYFNLSTLTPEQEDAFETAETSALKAKIYESVRDFGPNTIVEVLHRTPPRADFRTS